jgi:hypothetical protein
MICGRKIDRNTRQIEQCGGRVGGDIHLEEQ